MAQTLTKELLAQAQIKLAKAEQALQANPTNKWLQMKGHAEQDKVETIRQSPSKSEVH